MPTDTVPPILKLYDGTPSGEQVSALHQILWRHNERATGQSDYRPLYVLLHDDAGEVVGGLEGATYWGWLYVEVLAIREEYRGQNHGSALLRSAEEEAIRRGCHHVYLDTFDFQALPFYERYGYTIYGTLEEFPSGHKRYFLQKTLQASQE